MTDLQAELYLHQRADRHGISVDDLLSITPENVADSPQEAVTFWEQRDISHIKPVSMYPHLADDPTNMIPEDPSDNRSRGAQVMTQSEKSLAELENEVIAAEIDGRNEMPDILDIFPDIIFA